MAANGKVIWFTGLSGAGKTTVSGNLADALRDAGQLVQVLDGDIMRTGLCSDLGFRAVDRRENVRRIGEVSRLFADAGFYCLVSLVSPYLADRARLRKRLGSLYVEVFVDAPLEVCEKRDPKGLYAKARRGELSRFTGISDPYEAPENPDIHLRTDRRSVEECVTQLLRFLGADARFPSLMLKPELAQA